LFIVKLLKELSKHWKSWL